MTPITARYASLVDRPVLVTGGADGIGAALVEAFARQGAVVGFLDIDEKKAEALIDRLEREGLPRPRFARADVRDVDALLAAIDSLEKSCGAFRVLVNNAGGDRRHRLDEITPEFWDERFALNLRPMVFAARRVAPGMAEAGGGSIVNLGSTSWMKAAPDLVAYGTAKAAVAGLDPNAGARARPRPHPRHLRRPRLGPDAPQSGHRDARARSPPRPPGAACPIRWSPGTWPLWSSGSPPTTAEA